MRQDSPVYTSAQKYFLNSLRDSLGGQLDYYTEYIDEPRFSDPQYQSALRDFVKRKYAGQQFDLIVTTQRPALTFVTKYGAELFPNAPVFFIAGKGLEIPNERPGPNFTGILYKVDLRPTMEIALKINPGLKHIFAITGASVFDKHYEEGAKDQWKEFAGRVDFSFSSGEPLEQLKQTVANLADDTAIMFVTMSEDRSGNRFVADEVLAQLAPVARVPIYGFTEPGMQSGLLGGSLVSFDKIFSDATPIALRILKGERPQDISVTESFPSIEAFNWRQLRRYNISESSLPAGSIVQFRELSFWQRYKWRIVLVVSLLLFQTVLIAGLLVERRRRWLASLLLATSEDRYRNVVELQSELICRYLPDTTLTFVNEAYCRYFHKSRDELIGSKFIDLIPPRAQDATRQRIRSLIENRQTETYEHEVVKPDGSTGWHQWNNHIITSGNSVELQGIGRDITDRKIAEEALIISEEFNRRIVESTTDCVKVLDVEGNLVFMSERGQQLLEIDDVAPFVSKSWLDLWTGEDRISAVDAVQKAAKGEHGTFRGFARTMKGTPRWWHTVITPMQGTRGSVERLLAVSRDVTEQELALKAIRESEERFAKAFNSNPQPMWLTTFDEGRFLDVNQSFLTMSGYEREEVIGRTADALNIYESPAHRRTLVVEPLLNGGDASNFEMNFRTRSGARKVLLSAAEVLELGGQKCILVASSDISERKVLEENLRLSEREFSTLVENSPDIICRLDRNLRYIYLSPAFEKWSGVPGENAIGATPHELSLAEFDWKGLEASCQQAIFSRKATHTASAYKGRHYWTRVIPEFSSMGAVESLMTISEDVTDRIRAEQELVQLTVRLFNLQDEERRRIARELHDVTAQNLFAISVNLAKLGQLDSSRSDEAHQLIEECQGLGDQSLQEIRTLSYLLHPPLLDQAGLVSALQWYVEGFTKRSGIYVEVYAQAIGRLPSDVEMALFRIVQEALTNVRRHSSSESASIKLERRPHDVVLEIKDRGHGLSHNIRDSNGLISVGVGIPGMRQRIRQLGGQLEISSSERGTTISAVVPLANGAKLEAHAAG